jgi:membrane protein insertase Oxa1/YidC/SpoIIIJ
MIRLLEYIGCNPLTGFITSATFAIIGNIAEFVHIYTPMFIIFNNIDSIFRDAAYLSSTVAALFTIAGIIHNWNKKKSPCKPTKKKVR